jgi:hypothetical protein
VGNILKRRGLLPAPERKKITTWKDFIRSHMEMLWATDFFSTEVWTLGGLVTFYVLFFIKLDTREVHIAGITSSPNEQWMMQVARNLTMNELGIPKPGQYLIHDRDKKFCLAYHQILDDAGVKRLPLPPRSPNLNSDIHNGWQARQRVNAPNIRNPANLRRARPWAASGR